MTDKEIIEFFEHSRLQIAVHNENMLPTSVGTGFVLNYKGNYVFITADHIVNVHEKDQNTGQEYRVKNNPISVMMNKVQVTESGSVEILTFGLSGFYDFTEAFVNLKTGEVKENPRLFDAAVHVLSEAEKVKFSNCLTPKVECNGVTIPMGENKTTISENNIGTADKNDVYSVAGRVKFDLKKIDKQIYLMNEYVFNTGLKLISESDNYYILQYPKPVKYEDWGGLSGSPVISNNGKLIGIQCGINENDNTVWVKKIQSIIPLIEGVILNEKISNIEN